MSAVSRAADAACCNSIRLGTAHIGAYPTVLGAPSGRAQTPASDTYRQAAIDALQEARVDARPAVCGMRIMVREIRGVLRQTLVSFREDHLYSSHFRILRRISLGPRVRCSPQPIRSRHRRLHDKPVRYPRVTCPGICPPGTINKRRANPPHGGKAYCRAEVCAVVLSERDTSGCH